MLVVPDICNPFYSQMAGVIQQRSHAEGYTVTLYNTNEDPAEELQAIRLGSEIHADGLVLASVTTQNIVIQELLRTGIPIVVVNSYESCPFDSVHGDRFQGTYIATKHLLNIGHTRIAFAGGLKGSAIGKSRKTGYLMAMEEANVPSIEDLIFEMGFNIDFGKKAGRYFSVISPQPTAICCANDMVALGIMSVFKELGASTSIPYLKECTGAY